VTSLQAFNKLLAPQTLHREVIHLVPLRPPQNHNRQYSNAVPQHINLRFVRKPLGNEYPNAKTSIDVASSKAPIKPISLQTPHHAVLHIAPHSLPQEQTRKYLHVVSQDLTLPIVGNPLENEYPKGRGKYYFLSSRSPFTRYQTSTRYPHRNYRTITTATSV
jgi:hypothetical protein